MENTDENGENWYMRNNNQFTELYTLYHNSELIINQNYHFSNNE